MSDSSQRMSHPESPPVTANWQALGETTWSAKLSGRAEMKVASSLQERNHTYEYPKT
jgi:hypothetical protein